MIRTGYYSKVYVLLILFVSVRSGGVVNLCIGSSIMSFMEFCLVLIKVSIYIIMKVITSFLELI